MPKTVPRFRLLSAVFVLAALLAQLALTPQPALAEVGEYTLLRAGHAPICASSSFPPGVGGVQYEYLLDPTSGCAFGSYWYPFVKAYSLRPVANKNLCVDIPSGLKVPGNQLQLWDCNGFVQAQGFYFSSFDDGVIRTLTPIPGQVNMWQGSVCVDVPTEAKTPLAPVIVANCDASDSQRWDYDTDDFLAENANDDLCMHVSGGVVQRGAKINLYQCGAYSNDRLELENLNPA